jgi:histidyl-tRNA synthetase
MSQALQPVRGTHDLLAKDAAHHQQVALTAQAIAALYGYQRMDTPIFEFSEVFHRAVGETSDIVAKETYSFTDRGGESITLRPEFTAAIVRAFISNKLTQELPFKCFYAGPAFRYERPQKGRLRQFHQIGAELLGAAEPEADIEMIAMAMHVLETLGLKDMAVLEINSLGDPESRSEYRNALVKYLGQHQKDLSADSLKRLEKNPLRILDSKDEGDRSIIGNAPKLSEYFNDSSKAFFTRVLEGLAALGFNAQVNTHLVRGLDYYSHTVFEVTTDRLGAQGTILAGGRYDGLVKLMGGPDTPGIGWAAGIERLVALMEEAGSTQALAPAADVAVIPMQESADAAAWKLAQGLRHGGYKVEIAYKGKAGKRMQKADKLGAKHAVMIGEDEMKSGKVVVKDLASGEQQTIAQDALFEYLRKGKK